MPDAVPPPDIVPPDTSRGRAARHAAGHVRVAAPSLATLVAGLRPPSRRSLVTTAAVTGLGLLVGAGAAATGATAGAAGGRSPAASVASAPRAPRAQFDPLSVTDLSRGAPAGAKLLPARPVHVTTPAPVTGPVISGLAANGIPAVALNAYRVAAARMASASPGCGLDWSLLAGIGRVESDHGRFAGAVLHADGTSTPRIYGPPLDGTAWDYIADTDGGRIDGLRTIDRAVGPMQFIPSTWTAYASDGNGDGVADPFNINDEALAAARYLCAAGGDLRTASGRVAAVLAYNHSDAYLAQVLALAAAYAGTVPVRGIPITGPTTGGLPPVGSGSSTAPVNPADPPAAARPGTAGGGSPLSPASASPGHVHGVPAAGGAAAGPTTQGPTSPAARPSGTRPSPPTAVAPTSTPGSPAASGASGAPGAPGQPGAPAPTASTTPPTGPVGTLLCSVLGVLLPCPR